SDLVVLDGLLESTTFRFAPDGRIFVAEKRGRILVFSGPGDTRPALFADLSRRVFDGTEHGLFGLALDPAFPRKPFFYVLYTHDAPIGGQGPVWRDACPHPAGEPQHKRVVCEGSSGLT